MDVDKESLDAITEIINIGVGRSASLLNQMTDSNIRLRVPKIFVIRFKDLADTNTESPWRGSAVNGHAGVPGKLFRSNRNPVPS